MTFAKPKPLLMKKLWQPAALLVAILFSINMDAQNNDPCGCDKALPEGLRDEITSIYSVNLDSSLTIIYNKSFHYWENGEWKNDKAMQSGGQAYSDLFSGFLNGSQNEDQKYEKFKSDSIAYKKDARLSFSQYQYLSQKTASLTAYTAWSLCKHDCTQLLIDGEILITKSNIVPGEIRVDIILKKGQHSNRPVKILQIISPHIKMVKGNLKEGKVMNWGKTYSANFKLETPFQESAIKINLNDNWSTDEVILPAINSAIGSKKPAKDSIVSIGNGSLNVNSRMGSNWGTVAADPVNQWSDVPLNDVSRKYDAAWLTTSAAANSNTTTNYYTWTLDLENRYGAQTRPDGSGRGWCEVNPEYSTFLSLPQLENYTGLSYTVVLKCEMHLGYPFADQDALMRTRGKVEITGRDNFDRQLSVQMDSSAASALSIDNLQPGLYKIDMQGYLVGLLAAGFDVPSSLNVYKKFENSYKIKLTANVTTHGVKVQPPPPPKNYLMYYLIGVVVLAVLIGLIIINLKKR